MTQLSRFWMALAAGAVSFGSVAMADDEIAPASERFASKDAAEVPKFQQHVVPLLSRLGCNGRACHGSFQGQGGFRLSLFGYDFKLDHDGLTKGDKDKNKEPRILVEEPEESLALLKATQEMPHRGGKRMDADSWQYNIFRNWIKDGAKTVPEDAATFVRLDVTPKEIQFGKSGEASQLKVIAVWSDGIQEDVTPLCRFNSNDDLIAAIDSNGLVKSGDVGDTHVVVNYDQGVVPIPVIRPVSDKTGDKYPQIAATTKIDELVVQKLRKLGIVPSELCDDHEFLRRVSLDLAGTLPSPQEVTAFLSDTDSNKRAKKIDELLERPGYVAWWTTKLCDFTGNNAQNLQINNGFKVDRTQEWYDWIYRRVAANEPYDKLIEGIVTAVSRKSGESYTEYCERMTAMYGPKHEGSFAEEGGLTYFWARRNFQKPEERAIGFAYTFMGIRIQCAQCHKHPFDQWTQNDFNQFTGFFKGTAYGVSPKDRKEEAALKEKLGITSKLNNGDLQKELTKGVAAGKVVPIAELYTVRAKAPEANGRDKNKDKDNGKQAARQPPPPSAKLLGSETVVLSDHDDVRVPLMSWLRDSKNPYFAKAFVNRVWANYFNVGIVQPVDDMSLANAPSNAALLNYLAEGFIEHNFDMKWLHREICNSATYQRSWKPNATNTLDQKNFSHAIPRRLPAEVALDALKQATLSDSAINDWLAANKGHMTAVPGSTGRNNGNGPGFALTVFGRSTRESNCDCDRSTEASLLQTVYLQNDDEIGKALDDAKGWVRSLTPSSKRSSSKTPTDPKDAKARKNFEQLLSNAERDLKKARRADNQKDVKELEERVAELKDKLNPQEAPVETANVDADGIIKSAYLRTLSRLPSESEIETSKKFLTQAETPIAGARDLLWALINTKEFIVNH